MRKCSHLRHRSDASSDPQHELDQALAHVQRLEQALLDTKARPASIATLLANASHEELAEAVEALSPARRQQLARLVLGENQETRRALFE